MDATRRIPLTLNASEAFFLLSQQHQLFCILRAPVRVARSQDAPSLLRAPARSEARGGKATRQVTRDAARVQHVQVRLLRLFPPLGELYNISKTKFTPKIVFDKG